MRIFKALLIALFLLPSSISSNTTNSFGTVGINMTPTARFFEEGSIAFSLSRHDKFSRTDLLAQPYEWLEVSIFYADIFEKEYQASFGAQSYKDKGFNAKFLLKKESEYLPQIALGLSDFAGTGLFSSEYIVSSKSFNNFDFSLGIGWGLHSYGYSFKNPFRFLSDSFNERNLDYESTVGKFDSKDLFSGKNASLFASAKYKTQNGNFYIETNPTSFKGRLESVEQTSKFFLGYEYSFLKGLNLKLFAGNKEDFNINFSSDFNYSKIKTTKYKEPEKKIGNSAIDLISSLQINGVALKNLKIDKDGRLVIGIRQNSYQDKEESYKTVLQSLNYSGINNYEEVIISQYFSGKEITKKGYSLDSGAPISYPINTKISKNIYSLTEKFPNSVLNISPSLRTLIGAREGFLYYGLMLDANYDVYFSENFYLSTKTTYSITDNFDGLYIGPVTTYPAQVRTDIKDYLKNLGDKPSIERFELNYLNSTDNHFIMAKAGVLESMFAGIGLEYLNYNPSKNYAIGFDLYNVKKRDYDYSFETLDYEITTGHINYYHYFHPLNLTTHISWGRYLAGDEGFTFDFSRRFKNGTTFGAFFSLTDVSFEQFGEGSFDKGVYINIPIGIFGKNSSGFVWKPLTKDPAQKLNLSSRIFGNINRYIY